jgi:hypothetical protein
MSGAPIPHGSDAVVSQEFASDDGKAVRICNHAHNGRNILKKAQTWRGRRDHREGNTVHSRCSGAHCCAGALAPRYIRVRTSPLSQPGTKLSRSEPLESGKVFASNLVTIAACCGLYGMSAKTVPVRDTEEEILDAVQSSPAKPFPETAHLFVPTLRRNHGASGRDIDRLVSTFSEVFPCSLILSQSVSRFIADVAC